MVLCIEVTCKMALATDQAHSSGPMEHAMKVNGAAIKQMELANFGTLMAMFMKANGRMIKQMDTEFTCTLMAQDMKVTGKMIYKMAKESNRGVTDPNIKVAIEKA